MLRKSFINKIEVILESTPLLSVTDFDIISEPSRAREGSISIRIIYRYGDGEYLEGLIGTNVPNSSAIKISIVCNPGDFAIEQEYVVVGFQDFFEHVQAWAGRISEELRLIPINRQIEEQRDLLQSLEDQISDMGDKVATLEELEKLRNWMNTVETELKDRIEHLEIKDKDKEKRIEELSIEFEVFRARASKMPVKRIFQAVFTRIYKVGADPNLPKLIENGVKIIKMLPPP